MLLRYALLAAMAAPSLADEVRKPVTVAVQKWRSKSWNHYETVELRHLADYRRKEIPLSKYGGRRDRREEATGYFYAKQLAERWVLVDPEGFQFTSCGVNSVAPNDTNTDTANAFERMFGDVGKWARQTRALLTEQLRFNTLGCWSSWADLKQAGVPVPYTRRWNMMAAYATKRGSTHHEYGHTGFTADCIPVFDPEFGPFCDTLATKLAETKDDPWLIGHFSDNELPLKRDRILSRYLSLPATDPGHRAAAEWLRKQGK